jgi:hypothetical protein
MKLAMARNWIGGFFITMTYPGEFTYSLEEVHTHLANMRKRLIRQFPDGRAMWRMEIMPRQTGASRGEFVPHFHLLLLPGGEPMTQETMAAWIRRAWWEVVGSGDPDHEIHGADVRLINNRRHANSYVSKYAAKQSISHYETEWTGRHWGYFGEWDFSPALVIKMSARRVIELKRMAVKLLEARHVKYARRLHRSAAEKGWSVFGLGDVTHEVWTDVFDSTVLQMIMATSGE